MSQCQMYVTKLLEKRSRDYIYKYCGLRNLFCLLKMQNRGLDIIHKT